MSLEFKVEQKVKELGIKILGIIIEDVDNKTPNKDFEIWRKEQVNKLVKKYQDYDIKSDDVIEGFYELHQKVGVPRRKNLPASENLIKLLAKRGELIEINKAVDIYNLISIDSKLCLGAHDIDKIGGNVTLKITNGNENFIPLGAEDAKKINAGEYSFVDDENDVICWLDIRQVDKTKVTEESKNILYFVIGNEKNTYDDLENVANEIITNTLGYCGGSATIIR